MSFLLDPITVEWDTPPLLEKKPRCPDRFTWHERSFEIIEVLGEWRDYRRRGRMAYNMRPEHARRALLRGSRGVGRYYFRVCVRGGHVYELYFDRAAAGKESSAQGWFISRDLGHCNE
ncbi:MAG: DUF6504 family protein [Candidatus Promineifilaceae bacterium]